MFNAKCMNKGFSKVRKKHMSSYTYSHMTSMCMNILNKNKLSAVFSSLYPQVTLVRVSTFTLNAHTSFPNSIYCPLKILLVGLTAYATQRDIGSQLVVSWLICI